MTKLALFLVVLFSGAACTPVKGWYISHAVAPPPDERYSREYHSCRHPGMSCPEGWACVRHGCEWCDADHQPDSRCVVGDDGSP